MSRGNWKTPAAHSIQTVIAGRPGRRSAWDEYGHDEERAHRFAWGAVEKKYQKDDEGYRVEKRAA